VRKGKKVERGRRRGKKKEKYEDERRGRQGKKKRKIEGVELKRRGMGKEERKKKRKGE